jgi:hypothetical protein
LIRKRGAKSVDWKVTGTSVARDVRAYSSIFGTKDGYAGTWCDSEQRVKKRNMPLSRPDYDTPNGCPNAKCKHAHNQFEMTCWQTLCPFGALQACTWGEKLCPFKHSDQEKHFRKESCVEYEQRKGKCPLGELCRYYHDPHLGYPDAHPRREDGPANSNAPKYRARECSATACVFGAKCRYMHPSHELWTKGNPPFRFTECDSFVTTGECFDSDCERFHPGEHSTDTVNNSPKRPTHIKFGTGWENVMELQYPELIVCEHVDGQSGMCSISVSADAQIKELCNHLQHMVRTSLMPRNSIVLPYNHICSCD